MSDNICQHSRQGKCTHNKFFGKACDGLETSMVDQRACERYLAPGEFAPKGFPVVHRIVKEGYFKRLWKAIKGGRQ